MQYEQPEKPMSQITPPEETKSPRYDYQSHDARSFSLQYTPSSQPLNADREGSCQLRIVY